MVLIILVSALANCSIVTRRSLLLRVVSIIQCIRALLHMLALFLVLVVLVLGHLVEIFAWDPSIHLNLIPSKKDNIASPIVLG